MVVTTIAGMFPSLLHSCLSLSVPYSHLCYIEYISRYDYEQVDSNDANKLMSYLVSTLASSVGTQWSSSFTVASADEFTYIDPVDKSVSAHQGIRFIFSDQSRVIFRLSGTGSVGATIRMYIEKYENNPSKIHEPSSQALAPLIALAIEKAKIKEFTGRDQPTVIT